MSIASTTTVRIALQALFAYFGNAKTQAKAITHRFLCRRQAMDIIKEIGTAAMLEQLAEECAELGKAALKMARIIRKDNPTPVTIEQAKENLCEESVDVITCI